MDAGRSKADTNQADSTPLSKRWILGLGRVDSRSLIWKSSLSPKQLVINFFAIKVVLFILIVVNHFFSGDEMWVKVIISLWWVVKKASGV